MSLLPIVEREMRVASRQVSLYWSRTVLAGLAIFITATIVFFMWRFPPATMGVSVFYTLSCIAFFYAATAGIWITSDCISEEKRDGTLGLLFLTDLRSFDIVLGKLAATSLKAFAGLIAIFPVLGIPLLLGSVAVGEFWRVVLVLFNTLLLSLAAGIFMSSISLRAGRAAGATLGMMILLLGGAPILWGLVSFLSGHNMSGETLEMASIHSAVMGLIMAFEGNYMTQSQSFWHSLWINQGFILFLLIGACVRIPRNWQDKALNALKANISASSREKHSLGRKELLTSSPIAWLRLRQKGSLFRPWIPFFIGSLAWIWGSMVHGRWFYGEDGLWVMTIYLSATILKCMIGVEMAHRICEDRRSGALELLFTTSISVKEVTQGHWEALMRQYRGPIALVVVISLFLGVLTIKGENDPEGQFWLSCMLAGHLILLFLDVLALFWFGLWSSLKARRVNQATRSTLFYILALPWILYWFLQLFSFQMFSLLFFGSSPRLGIDPGTIMLIAWLLVHCPWAVGLGFYGKKQVLEKLKHYATTRPGDEVTLVIGTPKHQGKSTSPTT